MRRHLLVGATVASTILFLWFVDRHYPLDQWMFFHYARASLLAGVFALSCLVSGHALLVRLLGRTLPLEEHFAIAFPLGILAFSLTSFAFGIVGLYGPIFFFADPFVLLSLGARDAARTLARLRRHLGAHAVRWAPNPLGVLVLAFGVLGGLLVWFTVLTPETASYDARWYHLPIAQHYVARGRIEPFREGWVSGALPQLASLLYAWALSAPGALFDRVETAAHVELVVFLSMLAGVAAMARRALGQRLPLAWTAVFLFPGIYCYDSGLVLGADHVAAAWAAPILLLSLRYWEKPSRAIALLLGAVIAGALSTKYTAALLVPFPLLVVLIRATRDGRRSPRGVLGDTQGTPSTQSTDSLRPAGWTLGSIAVLTAPHWAKNALFYGDPLFPLLRNWLHDHPWSQAAELPFRVRYSLNAPAPTFASVVEMAKTLVTFSFIPHDWSVYHRDVPVFGSLFTLCTPLLLFLKPSKRLLLLFGASYLGVATWFWIQQYDRYLQAVVPMMAAATAVTLVLVWKQGGYARMATVAMVGAQVVWGGDVYFFPSHRGVASGVVAKTVIDLLGRGYQKDYRSRFMPFKEWQEIGAALPPHAKVLVHEELSHFGLNAATALDYSGHQGLFYWGEPEAATPYQVWKILREQDVTHVLWAPRLDHATDTVAGGLVFFEFVTRYTKLLGTYGGLALAVLDDQPPPPSEPGEVAYYPCESPDPFAPGLYPLTALSRWPGDLRPLSSPEVGVSMDAALKRAHFAVFDPRCHGELRQEFRSTFDLLAARGESMLLARRENQGAEGSLPAKHHERVPRAKSTASRAVAEDYVPSGDCPLKTRQAWQTFLEDAADDPAWTKTCSDHEVCQRVVGDFTKHVQNDVLATLSRCQKDVVEDPAIARCTSHLRQFAPSWTQQHDDTSYGFRQRNHEYLTAQQAPDTPIGMMEVSPALLAALPSRRGVERAAEDNGWPYVTHDSCLGGVRTFLLITDPEGRFDQWMLVNFDGGGTNVTDAGILSFLAVQKKSVSGDSLPVHRVHFRDYRVRHQGDAWSVALDEKLAGKCYACHVSGVRELLPTHGTIAESRPVRGEKGFPSSNTTLPSDFGFHRVEELNAKLRSYGPPDWNGTIDPDAHGPALGAQQGCVACHDGESRGAITVTTSEGTLRQKIAERLSMGSEHGDPAHPDETATTLLDHEETRSLSASERTRLEAARIAHRRDLETFLARRFPDLRDWLLADRCD